MRHGFLSGQGTRRRDPSTLIASNQRATSAGLRDEYGQGCELVLNVLAWEYAPCIEDGCEAAALIAEELVERRGDQVRRKRIDRSPTARPMRQIAAAFLRALAMF
jgi:hypothetical protein